jgi:oligosaccharide repeat unit polymerase
MGTTEKLDGQSAMRQGMAVARPRVAIPMWTSFLVVIIVILGALVVMVPAYVALCAIAATAVWGLLRTKPKNITGLVARFAILGVILAIGFAVVERESAFLLPALVFALIGGALYAKRHDPAMDLFAPFVITCVGFLVLFAWVPLQHLWNGDIPPDLIMRSVWYISIGFICFLLGYEVPIPKTQISRLWLRGDNWSQGRMTSAAVICFLIGLGIFYYIMRSAGYESMIAIYRDVLLFRFSTYGELSAFVYLDQAVLSTGCILLALRIFKKRHVLLRDVFALCGYLSSVFAIFAAFGTRGAFLTLLVGMVMCFHYLKRRIKPRQLALVAIFAVLFAAGYGLYRNAGSNWESAGQAEHALGQLNVYDAVLSRLDCFSVYTVVLDHPPRLDGGSFFRGLLLRPLPRSWLPDKPLASSSEITMEYWPGLFNDQIGLETSIFGELYYYFGFYGILFGMMVFGLGVKVLQKYYDSRTARSDFLLHYALVFTFPVGTLMAGFDSLGIYVVASFTMWIWLVLFFLNAKGLSGRALQSTRSEVPSVVAPRAFVKNRILG